MLSIVFIFCFLFSFLFSYQCVVYIIIIKKKKKKKSSPAVNKKMKKKKQVFFYLCLWNPVILYSFYIFLCWFMVAIWCLTFRNCIHNSVTLWPWILCIETNFKLFCNVIESFQNSMWVFVCSRNDGIQIPVESMFLVAKNWKLQQGAKRQHCNWDFMNKIEIGFNTKFSQPYWACLQKVS